MMIVTHNERSGSPPPCGEGLGVGVPKLADGCCHPHYPPPQPSPTRGEGAPCGKL
jgi:tRNA pseudouridine32 synthase / 23S rRNA pseudouridine746 synthase